MSTLNDFTKKTKFSMAAIYTPRENHEELKEKIDELYGLKIDEFSGTTVLDMGIGLMQETYKMETSSELNPIIDAINSLKVNMALYSIVRSFVFDFAKFGPEIYEKLEQSNITPEKQWQINLKKIENDFLYGKGTDEQAKKAMVKVLSETKTPITLKQLSVFLYPSDFKQLRSFLIKNNTAYIDNLVQDRRVSSDEALKKYFDYVDNLVFNISFDKKTGNITVIPTNELSKSIKPEFDVMPPKNIKTIELSQLAEISEQAMKDYLNSEKVEETENLSKNQNMLLLKSFIKVAQKFQGIERIREREISPPDNDPPLPPPSTTSIPIKNQKSNDEYKKYDDKNIIPNIIVEPKQPDAPDREYYEDNIVIPEVPDFSPKRNFDNPKGISIADELLSNQLSLDNIQHIQKQDFDKKDGVERTETQRYRDQDEEMCR